MVKNPFEGLGESLRNTFNPKEQSLPSGGAWTDDAIDALNEVWGIDKTKGETITPAPSRPKKLSAAQDANSTSTAKTDGICQECPKDFYMVIERQWEEKPEDIGNELGRVVSIYKIYIDGKLVREGMTAEIRGSGSNPAPSNAQEGNKQRIEPKSYPLLDHGTPGVNIYSTKGYSTDYSDYGKAGKSLPAIRLGKTKPRTAILIHPMHEPNGYVSSIGCINPAPKGAIKKNKKFSGQDSMNEMLEILKIYNEHKGALKSEIVEIKDIGAK